MANILKIGEKIVNAWKSNDCQLAEPRNVMVKK